ncbi:MAG: DUF11 domain-containing protein [Spartobacteria bacterium]|nr:DUF11 domain-containing protein [Spartobacteria bacterium]
MKKIGILVFLVAAAGSAMAGKIPFGPRCDIALNNARSMAAGDINNDGYMDLLGASISMLSNSIACWLSVDGSGTNWTGISVWTNAPQNVRLADMDGDGDLDSVAIVPGSKTIFWSENVDGTGSNWVPHYVTTNWAEGYDLCVADMDGDSHQDVIAYNYSAGRIDVWLNVDGSGLNWTSTMVTTGFSSPTSLDAADIDRDGDMDIVGTSRSKATVSWFENVNGNGTNWVEHVVSSALNYVQSASVADINNDGLPDIVAAGQTPDIVRAFINVDGSGTNWQATYIDSSAMMDPSEVFTCDLDRDGDIDVLCASEAAGDLVWYDNPLSEGGGAWTEYSVDLSFSGVRRIGAADMNGDGNTDYLAAGEGANKVSWFPNRTMTKTGGFTTAGEVRTNFTDAYSCRAADFDGDGDVDVVGSAMLVSPELMWAENLDGHGEEWAYHDISSGLFTSVRSLRVADINRDGRNDVLATSFSQGEVRWWSNADRTGTNLVAIPVATNVAGASFAACADMNRDGHLDVVAVGLWTNLIAWWQNTDGTGTAWTRRDVAVMLTPLCAQPLDINRDGRMDIAAVSYTAPSNDICWWQNLDGTGLSWSKHVIEEDFTSAWYLDGADMDGDGDMDIYACSYGSAGISWWENMDGQGTSWTRQVIDSSFAGCRYVQAYDLDQDGDLDMAGVAATDNTLCWWENVDGMATTWTRHDISTAYAGASCLHLMDIDQDGMADMVTTAINADRLDWWQNRSGQYSLLVTSIAPDSVESMTSSGVFKVTLTHGGRAAQTNYQEWASLAMRLGSDEGAPLLAAQMDDLFNRVIIYLDDGSGTFDPAVDTAIWTANYPSVSFPFNDSALFISLPDGQNDFWVAAGTSKVYFVELAMRPDAHTAYPNRFVPTLLTGRGGSLVEEHLYDSPLRCRDWEDVPTGTGLHTWAKGDVGISKVAQTNGIYCGGTVTYTIAVTNFSAPVASGVVVTDSLPIGLSMTTPSPVGRMPGNVLRLHLDESPISNLTVLADTSGYTNHGIFRNLYSMNSSTTGKYNGGLANGVDRFIDLGNPDALNFEGEITLAAWIQPANTNAKSIFAHGADFPSNPALYFGLFQGRYLIGVISGATEYVSYRPASDDVGAWTHVAAIFDGDYWRIYHNGTLAHAQAATLGSVILDAPWSVGALRHASYTNEFFNGKLDEAMIFNRALSGQEIHDIYMASGPYATMSGSTRPVASIGALPSGTVATMSYSVQIASNRVGDVTNRVLQMPNSSFVDTNAANDLALAVAHIPDDYDQDGMYDPWEYVHQFSPTNPADAIIDSDGDRVLNVDEYIADTNPHASNSFFHITAVTNRPAYHVTFLSSAQRVYSLQKGQDLVGEVWSNVPGQVNQSGTGTAMILSDTNTLSRFNLHRVRVTLP